MKPFEKQINIEKTKIIKDDKELKEISGTESAVSITTNSWCCQRYVSQLF